MLDECRRAGFKRYTLQAKSGVAVASQRSTPIAAGSNARTTSTCSVQLDACSCVYNARITRNPSQSPALSEHRSLRLPEREKIGASVQSLPRMWR